MLVAREKMVAAPALASGCSALQAGALLHELSSVLFWESGPSCGYRAHVARLSAACSAFELRKEGEEREKWLAFTELPGELRFQRAPSFSLLQRPMVESGALTVTRTRFAGLRVRIPTHGR